MPAAKSKTAKGDKIERYIAAADDVAKPHLRAMLECLRKAAPGASEDIKWRMPSMAYQRILFQFAAFKKHVGFYPTPGAIREFESARTLIGKIARYRVRQVREHDAKWM